MASGSVRPGSISLSSDQVFDRNCSVCERNDKTKEAVNYCTACSEYFCQECLDFHNSLPVLKDHRTKLLGKSTMLKSPAKVGSRDTITTMCEDHSGKLIEMFCQTHNVVCCTICVIEKHRGCENVAHIPNIAGGFAKRNDTAKLKSEFQKTEKELSRIKSSRQNDQRRIQRERDHVLTQIKDSRMRINAIFDELEKKVVDGARQRHRDFEGNIQTDLDACDNAIRKLEVSIKELDKADTNEAQLFVEVKKGIENLGTFRALAEQIEGRLGAEQIKFAIDVGIETYLSNLDRLGTFVEEIRAQTVVRFEDVKVKMQDDSKLCKVAGSTWLPDGGALLSDRHHNKLKRLDSSYRVTDSCSIENPRGVCYIPHTKEAAVCQQDGPVHIVSVGRTMTVIRSIKTDHWCCGVSYNNGQLFVGEFEGVVSSLFPSWQMSQMHVYDFVSGDHIDTQGQQIFSNSIRHIAANSDGTRIWVADRNKGLVQLDKSGKHLRTITDKELTEAFGVCLGRDNNILVCGSESRTVLQLSPDGEKISTLVRRNDLPADPSSICYDKDRARLLVTMWGCDHVKVFHIK